MISKQYQVIKNDSNIINFNDLIIFLKNIPYSFYTSNCRHCKINLLENPINFNIYSDDNQVIFRIELNDTFVKIAIKNLCLLVDVKTYQIATNTFKNIIIFNHNYESYQNLIAKENLFRENHPFIKISKYIYKHSSQVIFKQYLENQIFCKKTLKNRLKQQYISNITEIVNKYSGHALIGCSEINNLETPLIYKNKSVQYFIWIAPWAHSFLKNNGYFQIDASFKALKPYVYFIPLLIIDNAAIPLGISIGPSEKSDLYSLFFKFFNSIYNDFNISKYCFLSDQGKSIKKFINENSLERNHFLCFRHIIESIGSHTPGAVLTRRLLYKASIDEYEASLPQVLNDIKHMLEISMITQKQFEKILRVFNLDLIDNEVVQSSCISNNNSLWARAPFGISTCTNHIERIHRTLNCVTSKQNEIHIRLEIVFHELLKYFLNFSKNYRTQARKTLKNLLKTAANPNNCIIQNNNCNCGWSEVYSALYGIPNFPCIHRVSMVDMNMELPEIENINLNDIDFQNSSINESNFIDNWNFENQYHINANNDEKYVENYDDLHIIPGDEEKFLLQLANDAFYLSNYSISKQKLLIQISILWGKFITQTKDQNKEDLLSLFTIEVFKKYLDNT